MTFRFMLDTNTVSYAISGKGRVADIIREKTPHQIAMSAIVSAELSFGAQKKQSKALQHAIEDFALDITVLPFDDRAALCFGAVIGQLARSGKSLSPFDALIAAHAISLGLTLVSHDQTFRSIPELDVADWF